DASHSTGTITFTPYVAETGQTVSMKAANNATSTSAAFDILPNKLDHFTWTTPPPAAPTAGDLFNATVKAYDQYNNVKTNYSPTSSQFTLTGLHNSPNSPGIFGNSPSGNQPPSYGLGNPAWNNGVLTMTNAYDKDAETTKLTVTNTGASPDTPAGITK